MFLFADADEVLRHAERGEPDIHGVAIVAVPGLVSRHVVQELRHGHRRPSQFPRIRRRYPRLMAGENDAVDRLTQAGQHA